MSDLEVKPQNATPPNAAPAPEFAAATQPSYARTLFLGPDGLRPGWGFAFYVVDVLIRCSLLRSELASRHDFGASGLWSMMLEELGILAAALIPAVVLARVERRPWRVYGLPVRHAFGRLFWIGDASGDLPESAC